MSVSWTVVWIDAIHTWTNELRVMSCTGSCNRVIIMYLSPVPFTYFKSLLQLLSVLLFLLTRTIFAQIYKLHASSQWVQVELCVPVVGCIQMQAPNTFFFKAEFVSNLTCCYCQPAQCRYDFKKLWVFFSREAFIEQQALNCTSLRLQMQYEPLILGYVDQVDYSTMDLPKNYYFG